jgi:hypothetical protein
MITMDEGGYPWKGVARPRLQPWWHPRRLLGNGARSVPHRTF